MKTRSIMVQTLCVPCANRCRYCLLSWDGTCIGADYERSRTYAASFYRWLRENRPDLSFAFSFGYSMEHPKLLEAIDFMREIGSPGGEYLQFDGMRMRSESQLRSLMEQLKEHGIKKLNFTFYGTESYHDCFAGRRGDFALLRRSVEAALLSGLIISAGIPVTRENASQADPLLGMLRETGIEELRFFIPHEEGRGASLHEVRCREEDMKNWSEEAKTLLNRTIYRTEAEWLAEKEQVPPENRALLLSLTKDNIARLEKTAFSAVLRELEDLDEAYYRTVPSERELAERYGNKENTALYRRRDLFQKYRKQYLAENRLNPYDVTDERQSGSRRY